MESNNFKKKNAFYLFLIPIFLISFYFLSNIPAHGVYTLDDLYYEQLTFSTVIQYWKDNFIHRPLGLLWMYSLFAIVQEHYTLLPTILYVHYLLNIYLLFSILNKIGMPRQFVYLVLLVFFLFPFHEQNIFHVSNGSNLLATTFLILSFQFYFKPKSAISRAKRYFVVLSFLTLSLLTFEQSVFMWPLYFFLNKLRTNSTQSLEFT